MNRIILAAGTTLLTIGLVCLATLPFTNPTWMNVAQTGIVLGFLSVGVIVMGFVAYPMAQAEADCKRKACEGDNVFTKVR